MMSKINIVIVFLLLVAVNLPLLAQPGNPGSGPVGGAILLLLAGLGFGIFSLRNKKNSR
jgi:hypothetical protein